MKNRSSKLLALLALGGAMIGSTALAQAQTEIVGNLQIIVTGNVSPSELPRDSRAPIAVTVNWNIATTDGSPPPKLKTLTIEINRNGILDPTGLPICPYEKIQPASTSRALANCRSSLVGRGSFAALSGLEGQEPYVASGEMVVFNSEKGGKPVLFGQIYSAKPFANSFVITFKVDKPKKGEYGTSLTATLPKTLLAWGNLTEISMRLQRKFGYQGTRRSFLTASCPTPEGVGVASFRLARTSFAFVGGQKTTATLTDNCKVRR